MDVSQGVPTLLVAHFGSSRAGLATVGYTLRNSDTTVFVPRAQTGVRDFGDGDYGVALTLNTLWTGAIEWDTGETVPARAREEVVVLASQASVETQLAAINAKLAGMQVVTIDPVASTGDVSLTVGSDYFIVDGRALQWADQFGTWPDLTGAALTFTLKKGLAGQDVSSPGTVLTPSGANKLVAVELAAAWTAVLLPWQGVYELWATLVNTHKVLLATGTATVTT